jgi:hypothetical protein
MLIAGLLIVLASRGCDAVGQRYVDRLQAQSAIAPARFQQQWEQQRDDLRQQQRAINDQDLRTPTDNELLRQLNRRLEQLQTDMQRQQQELEQGAWRQLESVARDADANNKLWAYWRGLFFVFGTFLLTLGLLAISYGGDGAERWVCLVILAIIIYSLFVGGGAWSRQ